MENTMKQKTRILIYILTVSIILIAGVIIILASHDNKPEEKVDSHSYVDQGNLYLIKLSYDKAAVEYTEAIKIDPMNVEAYIGLATVYEKTGDEDKALDILRDGYEKTNDNSIKEKLDRLENKQRMAETKPVFTSPPLPEPIKVPDFYGLDKVTAESVADEMGISVVFAEEENERIPKGYVIKQDIPEGSEIDQNTEILLTVSLGWLKAKPLPVLDYENKNKYQMTQEEVCNTFIRAFQRKDVIKMMDIDNHYNSNDFDFVNGIEFEEYTVEMISDYQAYVELNIIKSDDPRFPVGKSKWYFSFITGMDDYLTFYNVDTHVELDYEDRLYDLVNQSIFTSAYIPGNADSERLKNEVMNSGLIHDIYHCGWDRSVDWKGLSKAELNKLYNQLYNCGDIPDEIFAQLEDGKIINGIKVSKVNGKYLVGCGHGAWSPNYSINSINEENGHIYIDLNICTDTACLVIEHRYIYDYTDNGDYFTLNSITEY